MSSINNRRLLLSAVGIGMLLVSLFAVAPVFAQSGTPTPQATSSSSGSTSATAAPSAAATQAVPSTGGMASQCFTYQDLVNEQLQPGSIYYVANSGDTLAKIAQMFGVSESQLISANSFLTANVSSSSSSSGSSSATSQATSSSSSGSSAATPAATSSSSSGGSSAATPAATSSSSGSSAATPAATSSASVPSTGGFSLNSCVVSSVSSSSAALDQGTFNGQNFVLMPGAVLRIPVSPSALVPATGGSAQSSSATPQATSSSSSSGSSSATPQATSSSSSSGSSSATPQATSSSSSSGGTSSATPQANQAVPATGLNFSVSPQEFQNRVFLFGVPEGTRSGDFYVAANGDSLSRLASRWGVSVSSILAVNPEIVNGNMIYRGEGIRVPAGASLNTETFSSNGTSVSSSNNSSGSGDLDTNESPSVDNDVSR